MDIFGNHSGQKRTCPVHVRCLVPDICGQLPDKNRTFADKTDKHGRTDTDKPLKGLSGVRPCPHKNLNLLTFFKGEKNMTAPSGNKNAAVDREALAKNHGYENIETLLSSLGGKEGKTNVALAGMLGVAKSTITRWMSEYKIEVRQVGGSQRHKGSSFGWTEQTTQKDGKIIDEVIFPLGRRGPHQVGAALRERLAALDPKWKRKPYAFSLTHFRRKGRMVELHYDIIKGAEVGI